MMRLVERGLMFGNLLEIRAPALVARYNRALAKLTGRTTQLEEFHIDISGFSPEIGDEFADNLYLNPDGFNRQFILLSIEQKKCPLLNARFSMSRDILKEYILSHEEQLFILTARDAVVGELFNSAYIIDKPNDLFSIRTIEIEADTLGSDVVASQELAGKIQQFMSKEDGWWDDVLIADMIELSKRTGNILRDPIKLERHKCEHNNFYTSHFGGVYMFRDMEETAVISTYALNGREQFPVDLATTLSERFEIAAFLDINELVEPIPAVLSMNRLAILQQKLDFIVIDTAAEKGEDLSGLSRRNLRKIKYRLHSDLPEEYHALEDLLKQLAAGQSVSRLTPEHPAYFYLLRSRNHTDMRLVNMLLAQLSPLDFRQMFICHKDAFYSAYRSWSDTKKSYVAQFLAEEYAVDKAGARAELFGPEPDMAEDPPGTDPEGKVWQGPWGPVPIEH